MLSSRGGENRGPTTLKKRRIIEHKFQPGIQNLNVCGSGLRRLLDRGKLLAYGADVNDPLGEFSRESLDARE